MLKRLVVALFLMLFIGCDDVGDAEQRIPENVENAQVMEVGIKNPAILPAYKLPGEEYVPGKQDAASDYRKMHPQWYAITEPPPAGFRPMKEWEPMVANIITYSSYLPGDNATAQTMADIVIHSIPVGEMWVIVSSGVAKADLLSRVKAGGITDQQIDDNVTFFAYENDAIWQIDYGPLPMVDDEAGEMIFQDFRYYHPRVLDDGIPTRLANDIGVTAYRSPFDFEGGNFQADGEEFCYTTERLYQYTGMNFEQVQQVFQTYYGCKKAVVVKDITDDGTGHIDMLFKLAGKHTAFVGEYTVVNDSVNKQRMDDNVEILEGVEYSAGGPGLKVYRIPFPHPKDNTPRTFINSTLFVSADGSKKVNLWPIYTVDKDLEAEARDSWEGGMPDWEHIGIISDQISLYSGAIHCVTRTVPAVEFTKAIADGECVDGACQGGVDAYDGVCISYKEPNPGCLGPKWQCICNHCGSTGCGIPETCGNGACDDGEGCVSCAQDCGCVGATICNMASGKCVDDPCGNGVCDDAENCKICPSDCGCEQGELCVNGVCTADPCDGLECGDNAGGDSCGECVAGMQCVEGACVAECSCDGLECGDDGCGGSCGECALGECTDGMCVCEPMCEDKECGDDGCGGSCGECAEGLECELNSCLEPGLPADGGGDIVAEKDIGGDDGGGGGDGCTTGSGSSGSGMGLILFAFLMVVAVIRRRSLQDLQN